MKAARTSIDKHLLMMGLAAVVLAGVGQVRVALAGEGKAGPQTQSLAFGNPVVFADDFETPSAQSPPANWAMWGAQQDKVPANYTRDTTQPHGGQACFRIHHPARTQAYIVSAPDRAVGPQRGMIYTVSFWARGQKAGKALFQWTAYRSIQPFVDAASPGSLPCDVGPEWRSYTYSVREGLDFFAEESRFLLLTFHATSAAAEEQTLWVDDVRVTEQADPNPIALLSAATIPHAALEHRLRPGDRLEFTISATSRLRPATTDVGGVSFHRVCGWTGQPYDRKGNYTLLPELEEAIRDLRLPMTRFYAVGDEPFGVDAAIDKVAEMCRRVGVPQDHCVLEFEEQGDGRAVITLHRQKNIYDFFRLILRRSNHLIFLSLIGLLTQKTFYPSDFSFEHGL